MIWEVKMPRLDEDMKEGTVTHWLKQEGEIVKKGEPIVEIETQKVNYAVESPGDGVLRLILAKEGELFPINATLGVIAEPDEDIRAYQKDDRDKKKTDRASRTEGQRMIISPIAKKLAQERNVDISKITGTGPGGRITKEDILHFHPTEKAPRSGKTRPVIRQIAPLSGIRKTIAERLSESWRNSPRAEHFISVDLTDFLTLHAERKEGWEREQGISPSVNDWIIWAAAKALRDFPMVNSSLANGQIEVYEEINISIAVALENGVITPVLRQADKRTLLDTAREIHRLVELVREGKHTADTLSGSTFTITNLGMFGVEFFVPVINPPESAILAVGEIDKKPVVIGDTIAIRSMIMLCLAFDHRILDGVVVARFLQALKAYLEKVESIAE
jgi:pyruvate dehydrogenase E2 component (dihydrolipoamide acetyltransferase)